MERQAVTTPRTLVLFNILYMWFSAFETPDGQVPKRVKTLSGRAEQTGTEGATLLILPGIYLFPPQADK